MKGKRYLCFCMALLFVCLFLVNTPSPVQGAPFYHGKREEKKIALTFDDGPHPRYTPEILRLLEQYGIKATFFVVGENMEIYAEAAKALIASPHEIGNHTYTHPHMSALDEKALREEIEKTEEIIRALGGTSSGLFRPPEGKKSAVHTALLEEMAYKTVLWSIDTRDWSHNAPSVICHAVLSAVQGGDILLFHDFVVPPNTTITALEQLIPQLLKSGYQFVTVSELLEG
ncbi:MAG: polysaccharide deacetylase family protein [Clostridia bacterium]|nr:polysaccharide deacetylase family protein [Clostridia bacterium]